MRVHKWRDGWGEGIREGRGGGYVKDQRSWLQHRNSHLSRESYQLAHSSAKISPNACVRRCPVGIWSCARPSKRTTCNMPRAVCWGTTASVRASSGRYIAPKYVIGPNLSRNRRPVSTWTRLPKYIITYTVILVTPTGSSRVLARSALESKAAASSLPLFCGCEIEMVVACVRFEYDVMLSGKVRHCWVC